MKSFLKIIVILSILTSTVLFFWHKTNKTEASLDQEDAFLVEKEVVPPNPFEIKEIQIEDGKTYSDLMREAEVDYALAMEIYEASKDVYDLVSVRAGKIIELYYKKETGNLEKLIYAIDTEEELHVVLEDGEWKAEKKQIEYEIKIKKASGVVESSMYEAAEASGIDIRAIIELANAFQWSIDFAMDPRVGDTFEFVYEERYLDGEYKMPGKILAGKYVNDGEDYLVYYFEESEDNIGYFDQDGNSVQKMFLKAPVAFKYISSGFTTGLRYVEAFNVSTGHRAIDYAAPLGTPIRAVGDGTITYAGWSTVGYGNLIKMRHNGTYSTNYAHLSKFAVKSGNKVKQGDVIGYVGSTGFSTGPHLHFEMVKNGAKINPLKEVLPPGEAINDENKERFFAEIEKYQNEYGIK